MVATPRKRTNEATHTTTRNRTRQSSTSRRKRNTRVNDSGTSGESAEQPSANEEVSQKAGRAGTSEVRGAETEVVSGELEVGDLIAYSNALDKPMRIIEILGDRFRIERLHDEAKFYVYRSLVVRCTEIVAAELSTVSTPEPELKSEAENFNSATPIETGDCVRGKTATGKEITGFALSVGRTCLKLTSGEFIAMDSVAVLARLPENLEQYCELPGKSRTEKLNELLGEYQFYNLSNWDTTPERGKHFWDYNGWEMCFYNGIEVDISKDDETWYTELKRHPEIKGNGDIYNYCVEAIDHAEGIIARLEEYEERATAHEIPPEPAKTLAEQPLLPTDEDLAASIVPNNPQETIEVLLSKLGFCPIAGDDFYPDGDPEPYRGWQLNTESHEGALMAVSISEDGTQWFSLPGEADEWNFGYRGHQRAIEWAKRFIDRLIEASDKASGQLNLLEAAYTHVPVNTVVEGIDQDESEENCQQIIVTQSQLGEFAELISCLELTKDKIRGTFLWESREWVATGGSGSSLTWNTVWAMSVVPVEQWTEPTYSYSNLQKNKDGTISRKGQLVKHKRRSLVLTGEKVEFVIPAESNNSQIAETQPASESQADGTLTKPEPSHITKDAARTKFDIGDEVVADYSRYDRTSPPPGLQQIKDGHSGRVSEVKTHGKHVEYLVCFDGVPGRIAVPEHFLSVYTHHHVNAADNKQLDIIGNQGELITSGSTLAQLAADINRLHSECEQATAIAQSAQLSALEHAKAAGLLLLQAKQNCGHGNWEKWREANLKLPSSTATLYQRIADRFDELQEAGIGSVKAAADYLKKPRLNPQPVAEMQPIVHEKDLVDSLEGLQADFRERKAAAEARSGEEVERKYERVEDIALPKFNELVALYEAIGDVRLTRDGKGFAVLRPDLGNPFPLSFRNREAAWDYWQRNKDKLLLLAERKPKPDYESSSISGWQQGDTLTTPEGTQTGKVMEIADNGKLSVKWENGYIGTYTPEEMTTYGYIKTGALGNTPGKFPNAVKIPSVNQTVWGLSEVHYAVRKFAVLNARQWDEQMCDEVAAAVLDFLAEY